jgi:predicted transcriptional regulator
MGQRIRHVMASSLSTVEPHTPLVDGARIMKQTDAGVVPVTANGSLTEMVTDRDIATCGVAQRQASQAIEVGDVTPAAAS